MLLAGCCCGSDCWKLAAAECTCPDGCQLLLAYAAAPPAAASTLLLAPCPGTL
jgi:hypothetical protein